jgi:hypothetical protein
MPISARLSGKEVKAKLGQLAKAHDPILVTLSGKEVKARLVQP